MKIAIFDLCEMADGYILDNTLKKRGVVYDEESCIHSVIVNSKEGGPGTLFVPLLGEHTDGHDYILDCYQRGTRVTLTSRRQRVPGTDDMIYIFVPDTLLALQNIAACCRSRFHNPLIGITGSVGKTTTKEMLSCALSTKYRVLKTSGNKNSQIGLPLMMMELNDTYDIAVIEMGMSMVDEMSRLTEIACPTAAVVTNIGVAHIGQLGTQEIIRREKMNIINEIEPGGKVFLFGDDPLLRELVSSAYIELSEPTKNKWDRAQVVVFGTTPDCDYYATNIRPVAEHTLFDFCCRKTGETEEISLPVLGLHHVIDAVAALSVAVEFSIPCEQAKSGLEVYQPMVMRGRIENLNGITLIDDTYNASPDSMKSGIDLLESMTKTGSRICVLADILELGDAAQECHSDVGRYASGKRIDVLITIGTQAKYISQGVLDGQKNEKTANKMQVISCDTQDEAFDTLKGRVTNGDIIYLKGSRGMKLDLLAQRLREAYQEGGIV